MADQLLPFPLTERSVHLCVDMQRIFSSEGPWPTPWMEKVLPVVGALVSHHPERTVFTRFIPPERPDRMPGMWQRYYTRWRAATCEQLDLRLLGRCRRFRPFAHPRPSLIKRAIPPLPSRSCSRIYETGKRMN
jgi:nicotinamidase-related amidase